MGRLHIIKDARRNSDAHTLRALRFFVVNARRSRNLKATIRASPNEWTFWGINGRVAA